MLYGPNTNLGHGCITNMLELQVDYILKALDTLDKNKSWGVFKKLDINKMTLESKYFLGKHDFLAFRSIDCQSNTSVKTISNIQIIEKEKNIIIRVTAKSFLHSQDRIMTATQVNVWEGKIKPSEIKKILEIKKISKAGITAPPQVLYLQKVDY